MNYLIFYDKQPEHFLQKCDKSIFDRITFKIKSLLENTLVPHQAKVLVGEQNVFRIRIGDYRALYRVDQGSKKIIIVKLDKRSRIY